MTTINYEDTLYAHHSFASHYRQALDQLVSEYLDSAPWKVEYGRRGAVKLAPEKMGGDMLAAYNAADVRLTAKVWAAIQIDLSKERMVYEHDLCLAELCSDMTYAGIQVDLARLAELSTLLAREAESHIEKMRELSGDPLISPAKPIRLRAAIYDTFKVKKTVTSLKTGKPSTGKEVIEALRGEDTPVGHFCHHLSKARECLKSKSTYVDYPIKGDKNHPHSIIFQVDGNGGNWDPLGNRAHYQWGPREQRNNRTKGGGHTVSGRLAGRLQSVPRYNPKNTPDRVREIYVPRSANHKFCYFDVKQGEPRVAAFLSGDPNRIATTLGDVHAENAKMAFPEAAAKGWLDGDAKKDPQRGKPLRDLMKNMGLAIDYFAEAERVQKYLAQNRYSPDGQPLYNILSLQQVNKLIVVIRKKYSIYVGFVHANLARVKECGYMRDPILGRIRWLGWWPSITDVANFPIQAALAAIMNLRSLYIQGSPRFAKWLAKYPAVAEKVGLPKKPPRPLNPRIQLAAQIHDACYYDTPDDLVGYLEDRVAALWEAKISLAGGDLVLPIDWKVGERMSEL